MPSNKREEVSEHEIEGRSVRIIRRGDREELWIDGKRHRFVTNSGGYVLLDNAYVPGRPDLLDAVRQYLSRAEPRASAKPSGEA